jgi:uncharacterized membrane protein YdbT with pleckstrin-like domain
VSFPEKVLADDETVSEHLHPHWITLVPATLWFIVICAAGGFAIAFLPSDGTTHTVLLIAVIVVALILLSWLSFAPWISWRTTHYVFTTHRVLIRRGVLHHVGRDIALQRISDVGYSQTLWDRIVGAGTLSIESAGEHGQESLKTMPHADRIQQVLNRLIEQDSERRARQASGVIPPTTFGNQAPPGYQQPGSQQPGYPQPGYAPTQPYPPQNQPPPTGR